MSSKTKDIKFESTRDSTTGVWKVKVQGPREGKYLKWGGFDPSLKEIQVHLSSLTHRYELVFFPLSTPEEVVTVPDPEHEWICHQTQTIKSMHLEKIGCFSLSPMNIYCHIPKSIVEGLDANMQVLLQLEITANKGGGRFKSIDLSVRISLPESFESEVVIGNISGTQKLTTNMTA